ncbi:CHAD domain-containing protein [Bradyrhizobium sp. GCM10027634]|uniref:CYTH and CHAD domain-containing protein n=1 Tax=unclassified Bradyrhizobium TaxID=2631580 RepID=UPI00263B22BC|nr:CYTH and CHAD domain-containing protein [Bradyrhizobium sp. WYCCWR 12677]MDN5004281.1 CHAD domain-containing protein [Bradyrhizobium sp. WYCCWR 12677]
MNAETELKFRIPPRQMASVLGNHRPRGDTSRQTLVSTYFDTRKHKLGRHGLTLRVREVEGHFVQTVKADGSGRMTRGEWESDVAGARPDLGKASNSPLHRFTAKKLARKLKPMFRTEVRRTAQARRVRNSRIELAIDHGRIACGRRSRPVSELELELKSGRIADLFRLARRLERSTHAELDLRSKSERGFELVAGSGGGAHHAEPIALKHALSPRDAFAVIARSALRQITANADAVRAKEPEGIHQMRVGLRRLRAAISLFRELLPRASTARIKAELKWLTNELAPARELDVYLTQSIAPAADQGVPKRGVRAIRSRFETQKEEAFARARDAVGSARYRRMLIDVMEWIESGRARAGDDRSIASYAAEVLDRRIGKVRKQGKQLGELDPRQRHKLRIRIKKIRYAVDFFESLYRDRDQSTLASLSDRLKRIQSALGSLNDFMAHRTLATEAALSAPPANRRAQAFVSGFIVGRERKAAHGLMQDAEKELHRLHRLSIAPGK